MDKTCGTCGKCRNTHDGPYCYKGSSPRPVSLLRVMDCWVDPSEVEQAVDAQKEKKNEVMTLQIDPSKIRRIDPRDLQHFDILQIVHELRRRGFHGSITIDI